MEFLSLLYQLIFMPIQIIFEGIYYLAFRLVGNPGGSIVALSFIVNLLLLPLYNRADAIQKAGRDIESKLSKGVEHIKKTFKGDEQLMMLQTYYRKNGYSPFESLKGSISLFLQIPFFVAAYNFLANLDALHGASLGPVKDLGVPDGLLSIAGVTINVLPLIMTAVNLISTYIFAQDLSRKSKLQLYGMACFFLVFLYASPAGLVFYWTLNNIFNLVKNIICRLDNVDKGIDFVMGLCGIFVVVYSSLISPNPNLRKFFYSTVLALLLNYRVIYRIIRNKFALKEESTVNEPQKDIFYAGVCFLAVLIGALIPSAVIESSPQEFVIVDYFTNPLWYVANSTAIAVGTFVLWGGVFYWLAPNNHKSKIERIFFFCVGAAIITYMFFGNDLGVLNSTLQYEQGVDFENFDKNVNLVVIFTVAFLLNVIWNKYRKNITEVLLIGTLAMSGMVAVNVFNIYDSLSKVETKTEMFVGNTKVGTIPLSQNGKNVIVFMLDRGMGEYIPYIFNEKPELKEKFSGFTFYKNTLSHGGHTIFGSPGLFGGYEYIPAEMNKRSNELLVDKHNEALRLMPLIFADAGFDVTVFDPPHNNYQEITDVNFFKDYKNIKTYTNTGRHNEGGKDLSAQVVQLNNRNFYCFAVLKCAPILMQRFLYDGGHYLASKVLNQEMTSLYSAFGKPEMFVHTYSQLECLRDLTEVVEKGNNFISMVNKTPHAPSMLQMPDYVVATNVDNTKFEEDCITRIDENGNVLKMTNKQHVSHYHINMATMLKIGEWLDYLKSMGVYNNTRIILAADHGWNLRHSEEWIVEDIKDDYGDIERYYPLLLVKDFDAKQFKVSNEFMTNADVPSIAFSELIDTPINPFTGREITNKDKVGKQFVLASDKYRTHWNTGNTFVASRWYSVHTSMLDKNNWKLEKEEAVLPY